MQGCALGLSSWRTLQGPYFCSWATRKSQLLHGNHMLGTLDFTATEHWANFSYSTALNRSKSSIEGLSESTLVINVQSTCTAVHVVCLQCSIKNGHGKFLIGSCSKSQPFNFHRLVTKYPANTSLFFSWFMAFTVHHCDILSFVCHLRLLWPIPASWPDSRDKSAHDHQNEIFRAKLQTSFLRNAFSGKEREETVFYQDF